MEELTLSDSGSGEVKQYLILVEGNKDQGHNWSVGVLPDGKLEITGNPQMDDVAKTFWEALSSSDALEKFYRPHYEQGFKDGVDSTLEDLEDEDED
jgi:hypothetical protein